VGYSNGTEKTLPPITKKHRQLREDVRVLSLSHKLPKITNISEKEISNPSHRNLSKQLSPAFVQSLTISPLVKETPFFHDMILWKCRHTQRDRKKGYWRGERKGIPQVFAATTRYANFLRLVKKRYYERNLTEFVAVQKYKTEKETRLGEAYATCASTVVI